MSRTAELNLRLKVDGDSGQTYVVTKNPDRVDEWQCSCLGWTRHYPRHDCKHIRFVKEQITQKMHGKHFSMS